jgi:hypothetical protein
MSLNFRLNTIRDHATVCYQTRTFDTPEEASAFVRAEASYMGPNWAVDRDDPTGRAATRLSVTTNTLIWASMLVGLPSITEANAERWFKRLATVEAHNGAYRSRDGEDVFFTLDEVKAHIGLSTNVSTETDAAFRAKVKRWEREAAKRAERAAS